MSFVQARIGTGKLSAITTHPYVMQYSASDTIGCLLGRILRHFNGQSERSGQPDEVGRQAIALNHHIPPCDTEVQ